MILLRALLLCRGIGLLVFAGTAFAWAGSRAQKKARTPHRPSEPSSPLESPSLVSNCFHWIDDCLQKEATRRELLTASAATAASAAISFLAPKSSFAAAPLDAGEAIRRGASNLPGYGSSDVFYPESFAGSWKVTRDVEFPSVAAGSTPPALRLTYPVRFIQSIEDGAVVADRGYNQAELEAALARRGSEPTPSSPSVLSYDWAANNPNVLRVALSDGTRKEIKVTKRATERTEDTVSSSEFQRITQEDTRATGGGPGSVPQITARRVVAKWKRVDESTLEGIEIVYAVGGGGDPLSAKAGSGSSNAAPTILSKSRLYLMR